MYNRPAVPLPAGAVTGIGSLPHICPAEAADFSLAMCPDLPFVPQLVRANPAEGMIAQVVTGLADLRMVDDRVVIDAETFDPYQPITVDLSSAAFTGLRTFLDHATDYHGPVKWQLAGPLTVGMGLMLGGVPPAAAFAAAGTAVRGVAAAVFAAIERVRPGQGQVVFFDEPSAGAVMHPDFPLAADEAIDLVSGSLAVLEGRATVGLHCCADADLAALLAAGPEIVSFPIAPSVGSLSGYIAPFLQHGGIIAWGVIPTDRPLADQVDRYWNQLATLWTELVVGGCDLALLRQQSLVTPVCGLATHTAEQATRIFALTTAVGHHIREQIGTATAIGGA